MTILPIWFLGGERKSHLVFLSMGRPRAKSAEVYRSDGLNQPTLGYDCPILAKERNPQFTEDGTSTILRDGKLPFTFVDTRGSTFQMALELQATTSQMLGMSFVHCLPR